MHYAAFFAAGAAVSGSWAAGAAWYAGGVAAGGFLLAFVFVQSHTATATLRGNACGFYTAQLLTTRNVAPGPLGLTTWLTGGLNYQIEHHLFPRLPRHAYGAVAPRVRALCAAHDVRYEELGLAASTAVVLRHLYAMGRPKAA